ncbi:MAG TPA: transporter associated domain-containing protein, partial [Woeseiaceae bacterium]|nr:transporter associated domain-containing protein [Woeseiaceae bacterium]
SLHAKATVELRKVCAHLNLPWEPEEEVATVGGLITERLGRLPARGDTVGWNGCRLEVLSVGARRPELIEIRRLSLDEGWDAD